MPESDDYMNTVDRMERDVTPVDLPAAAASIAISLKRIADAMEKQTHLLHAHLTPCFEVLNEDSAVDEAARDLLSRFAPRGDKHAPD